VTNPHRISIPITLGLSPILIAVPIALSANSLNFSSYEAECKAEVDALEGSVTGQSSLTHILRRCITEKRKEQYNKLQEERQLSREKFRATRNNERTQSVTEKLTRNTRRTLQKRYRMGGQLIHRKDFGPSREDIQKAQRQRRIDIRAAETQARQGVRYRIRIQDGGSECLIFRGGRIPTCYKKRIDEIKHGRIRRR